MLEELKGIDEDGRKVYLSLWTHTREEINNQYRYLVQQEWWGKNENGTYGAQRRDHDKLLEKVLKQGYEAYGYCVVAKDRLNPVKEIKKTITSFIFKLRIEQEDNGDIFGYVIDRIEM